MKVGGNNNFRETRGEKEGHQKFWRMKIETFFGKGKMLAIFHRVIKFSENRGTSETGGKCIMVSGGMDAPGRLSSIERKSLSSAWPTRDRKVGAFSGR